MDMGSHKIDDFVLYTNILYYTLTFLLHTNILYYTLTFCTTH